MKANSLGRVTQFNQPLADLELRYNAEILEYTPDSLVGIIRPNNSVHQLDNLDKMVEDLVSMNMPNIVLDLSGLEYQGYAYMRAFVYAFLSNPGSGRAVIVNSPNKLDPILAKTLENHMKKIGSATEPEEAISKLLH